MRIIANIGLIFMAVFLAPALVLVMACRGAKEGAKDARQMWRDIINHCRGRGQDDA